MTRFLSFLSLIIFSSVLKSQCFQIQSILVDACAGPQEGQNEMVTFQVGSAALNTANLSVNWPNNTWLGLTKNAGTAADIATVNATIIGCGLLKEPVAGVLPANAKVLLVSSTAWTPLAQSFVNLNDTLYVIFQTAGNTAGHFANYQSAGGLRTLTMTFSVPALCTDAVTYDRALLTNQAGNIGAQDGGAVEFTSAGVPTYVNHGCQAPFIPLSVDAGSNKTVCLGGTQSFSATTSGAYTSVNWSLGSGATGTFVPTNSLSTIYTPGASETGTVKLYCTIIKACGAQTTSVKDSVLLAVTPLPVVTVNNANVNLCAGQSTTITATSNVATYTWSPSTINTNTIVLNTTGVYTVESSNTCGTSSATVNVIVASLPTLAIISQTNVICFSALTGSATVLSSGGSGPYTYTWMPGNLNGTSQINLGAGIYTISTTDALSCVGSNTLLISQPTSSLSAIVSATSAASCGASSVTAFWTETFGVGCNQNQQANGVNASVNGAWVVTNTGANDPAANQWFISATESGMGVGVCGDGCLGGGTTNRTLHVSNLPTSPAAFLFCPTGDCGAAYDTGIGFGNTATDKRAESPIINCTGKSNITLDFKYIEGGQTTIDDATLWYFNGTVWAQIDNMPKTVVCGGSQGVWASRTIVLPASADNNPNVKLGFRWVNNDDGAGSDPSFAVDDITLSASSGALGGATVTANGGTAGYTYSWLPSGGITAGVNNLAAGNNTITVTDANGCIATTVVNITSAGGPTLAVTSQTNVNCFGATTGTATVLAGAGSGPYTYTWMPGNLNGASQTALGAGIYTISTTDAGMCVGSNTVLISQPSTSLSAAITATTTAGCGGSTGGATVTANGGTAGYTYSWLPSGGTTLGVNNLAAGSHTVTVTDANGCSVSAIANITSVGLAPILTLTSNTNTICPNETATLTVTGGSAPYVWSNSSNTGSVVTTNGGTVTVSNTNACGTSSAVVIVNVTNLNADVVANPTSGVLPVVVSFTNNSSNANSYIWDFGNGNSAITSTVSSQTYSIAGTYTVYLTASNGSCSDTDSLIIIVLNEEPVLVIPNVFTPNGDSINDIFRVSGKNISEFSCAIIDRWGLQMYYWNDIKGGWNGKTDGKEVPAGTYFYIINAKSIDDKEIKKQGYLNLFK